MVNYSRLTMYRLQLLNANTMKNVGGMNPLVSIIDDLPQQPHCASLCVTIRLAITLALISTATMASEAATGT